MQTLLTELMAIVRQEIDQYRQLLTLLRRERGRIVRGELAGLVEVVGRKEAITQALVTLADSRLSLLARIGAEVGEAESAITLSRLATLIPGETGDALRALLTEFRSVVGLLVAASDVNRTLLDRSLEFVQGSLEIFRTVASGPQTYGPGGRFNGAAHQLALNQTA